MLHSVLSFIIYSLKIHKNLHSFFALVIISKTVNMYSFFFYYYYKIIKYQLYITISYNRLCAMLKFSLTVCIKINAQNAWCLASILIKLIAKVIYIHFLYISQNKLKKSLIINSSSYDFNVFRVNLKNVSRK